MHSIYKFSPGNDLGYMATWIDILQLASLTCMYSIVQISSYCLLRWSGTREVGRSDLGRYTCEAENTVGRAQASLLLSGIITTRTRSPA
jgi:hypothetical protein